MGDLWGGGTTSGSGDLYRDHSVRALTDIFPAKKVSEAERSSDR